jgi:hypothetical protein
LYACDVGNRLGWIADRGHEIAMHTHFRRRDQLDAKSVPDGSACITDEDIVASLEADYAYLVDRGHRPRGFCAGGWAIHPAATEWLRTQDFHFDCSFRSFALGYDSAPAVAGSSHRGLSVVNGVLQVPTTATLKAMLLSPTARACPSLSFDGGIYTLFYLHDWDLLTRRRDVAFRLLTRRMRRWSVVPVRDLVRMARPEGD